MGKLDETFSRYKANFDISRVNAASGGKYVKVGNDTWSILESSLLFADVTGGHFDPTVGPLTDLWRVSASGAWTPPSDEQVSAVRKLVNYREIDIVSPAPLASEL